MPVVFVCFIFYWVVVLFVSLPPDSFSVTLVLVLQLSDEKIIKIMQFSLWD